MFVPLGAIRRELNNLLSHAGFQLLRPGERDHIRSYVPFKETRDGARKAGLSVGDYIDQKFHVPGATQSTIDQMVGLGILGPKIQSVCEIGPGTGRYLEKAQRSCAPCSYEIYETDREWSDWLSRTYRVTARVADGTTLRGTSSGSVDLVHAHKVFVYLPFAVTFQYFSEMIRVARPGAWIVFDIISEKCVSDWMIDQWIANRTYSRCMLPRDFVIAYFDKRQCFLHSSFLGPAPWLSEYLVFIKDRNP